MLKKENFYQKLIKNSKQAGLDYGHGTGHGVGYCLNVHEGPHRLSKYSDTVFQPGMIVTNGKNTQKLS